ncbi:hypothetical protein QP162_16505 [Sphingomonas aurantiaca]|uniref:hypothetical protein n=1 Tax=Sphingomonas aurantiaca TaxID=185949 RepID=UPI002FE3E1EB
MRIDQRADAPDQHHRDGQQVDPGAATRRADGAGIVERRARIAGGLARAILWQAFVGEREAWRGVPLVPQTTTSDGLEPGQAGGVRIDQLCGGGATIGVADAVADCSISVIRIIASASP